MSRGQGHGERVLATHDTGRDGLLPSARRDGCPPAETESRSGLYPRLLGADWHALAPAVRRAHADGARLVGIGSFSVRHGSNLLARLMARAGGIPPASEAAPVRVTIRRRGGTEHWQRHLAGAQLVTVQRALAGNLLAERLGTRPVSLELRFELSVEESALIYHQVGQVLRLGPVSVRVPHRLALRVTARERPDEDGISTNVAVVVCGPGNSLLFSYRGRVRWAVGDDGVTAR